MASYTRAPRPPIEDKPLMNFPAWDRLVSRFPWRTGIMVSIALAFLAASLWYVWVVWFATLWAWAGADIARIVGAITVTFLMGILTILVITVFVMLAQSWISSFGSAENLKIARAREQADKVEDQVLRDLEGQDTAGLLPLQRYSRSQLKTYYEIGLQQVRRSFVNATIAMWLGFLILLAGVALYVLPLEQFHVPKPTGSFNTIILASAVIVEVIAALFLWVYRSTIAQLTYYYRLQMHSHTSILCYRIAESMNEPDKAKQAIIAEILRASFTPERPAVRGASGLRGLLSGGIDNDE